MQQKSKTFEELITQASECLKNKLRKAENTIRFYVLVWRRIKKYMDAQNIEEFNTAVAKEFTARMFGNKPHKELKRSQLDAIHFVKVLCEFYVTGTVSPRKKPVFFEGEIGRVMSEYMSYKLTQRLKPQTIESHKKTLYRFLIFLNQTGISSIKAIGQVHLFNYIKTIDPSRVGLSRMCITDLRDFLHYIFAHHYTPTDLSVLISKFNRRSQQQLPSFYSKEEIEQLINAIDRGTKQGKREYVIVLLAARLGLRASDIANLKFENIDWVKCSIKVTQFKTGRSLELPLLPEIGDAFIDYLKYSRPTSESPYIFLLCRSPYSRFYPHSVGQAVQALFVKAGINTEDRKHGAHALRHSLAVNMLEKGTALPVISEVLGHEYTSSTEYYLRVDLQSMRKCVLEVPEVSPSFYNQKGGLFYAN